MTIKPAPARVGPRRPAGLLARTAAPSARALGLGAVRQGAFLSVPPRRLADGPFGLPPGQGVPFPGRAARVRVEAPRPAIRGDLSPVPRSLRVSAESRRK